MKRTILGGVAISALLIAAPLSAANAADMALKAPPVVLFDWTGWYGGVNGGYSWGRSDDTYHYPVVATTNTVSVAHHGAEASVEGGYCWQPRPITPFVACGEVRFDFPREISATNAVGAPSAQTVYSTTHVDPFLIGPHLGYLTNANHTMLYAAGGLAVGEVGGSATATGTLGTSTASPSSVWSAGWFVGAGVEHMVDPHWGLKLEYDYVRLDSNGTTAPFVGTNLTTNYPGYTATATLGGRAYDNIATVGINYHMH